MQKTEDRGNNQEVIMKKGVKHYLQYAVILIVVIILLCGVFSIVKRLTGTSSTGDLSGNKAGQEETTEKKADNSVPMTKLTVT